MGAATPRSGSRATAHKRLLTAALNQPRPSADLVRAINHLLDLTAHPLALRNGARAAPPPQHREDQSWR